MAAEADSETKRWCCVAPGWC